MKEGLIAIVAAAAPLFALDNSVTVIGAARASGSFPVTISRYFAKGEIGPEFPCVAPYIDGSIAAVWQCDRKASWSTTDGHDGSLRHAVITYWTTRPLNPGDTERVEFRPSAGLSSEGNGISREAAVQLPWNARISIVLNKGAADQTPSQVADAKTMLPALPVSSCGLQIWRSGPVVTEFIVKDRCESTSFDMGGEWNSGANRWDRPGSITYKSLNPAFQIAVYHNYPEQGRHTVRVGAIVENSWLGRRQNVRYSVEIAAGINFENVLLNEDNYHHAFGSVYRFEGWGNESQIPDYLIDPNFAYLIHSGIVPPYQTAPMVKGLPEATLSLAGLQAEINDYEARLGSDAPQFCRATIVRQSCRSGAACCGFWTKALFVGGPGPELMTVPRFYTKWLYLAGNHDIPINKRLEYWNKVVLGNANAAANAANNYRSDDPSPTSLFCPNHCATNELKAATVMGRPFSIDAVPNRTLQDVGGGTPFAWTDVPNCIAGTPCSVNYSTSATANSINKWNIVDTGAWTHAYNPYYFPYVMTGDWYWLDRMILWAGWAAGGGSPLGTQPGARNGNLGYWGDNTAIRRSSWMYGIVGTAAALTPDEFPEREYFKAVLLNNVAIEEGRLDIRTADGGSFDASGSLPCPSTPSTNPWIWGYCTARARTFNGPRENTANPLRFISPPTSWGANLDCIDNTITPPTTDCSKVVGQQALWMENYSVLGYGMAASVGFPQTLSLMKYVVQKPIQMVMNPLNGDPHIIGGYSTPVTKLPAAVKRQQVTQATISGTNQIRFTVPGHGYSTGNTVGICCISSGLWQRVRNYPLAVNVADPDNFTITLAAYRTAQLTGSYPGGLYAALFSTATPPYGEGGYFQTWAEFFDAIPEAHKKINTWLPASRSSSRTGSYTMFARMAIAYGITFGFKTTLEGGFSAQRAYDWITANAGWDYNDNRGSQSVCPPVIPQAENCQNPMLLIEPKPLIENLIVTPGASEIRFRFTAPSPHEVRIGLTAAPQFPSSSDEGDTVVPCTDQQCEIVLPANPATAYRYRITGGALGGTTRTEGTVSTSEPTENADLRLQFSPPPGHGVAHVALQHGPSRDHEVKEIRVPCSKSCEVVLPSKQQARYLHWSYLGRGDRVITTGSLGPVQ